MIRGIIFAYLVIFSGSSFIAKILKKKIGQILPFYLVAASLVAYFFGLCGILKIGYIAIASFSIVGELGLILYFAKKKKLKELAKEQLNMSFLICSLIYLLITIINFGRGINHWDDYMHWAPFAKETFRLMDFYTNSNAVTIHKDYPPIITVYQVFWQFLAGDYNESLLFIATQFLGLSLFMPFINKIKAKDIVERPFAALAVILAVLLVPMISQSDDAGFYHTLYMDFMIALLFAFALICIRNEKEFSLFFWLKLTMIFSFMLLIKQVGAFFIIFAIAYGIIRIIRNKKYSRILVILTTILIPTVLLYCWKKIVERTGFVGQFGFNDFVTGAGDLLIGGMLNLDEVDKQIYQKFLTNSLFSQHFTFGIAYGQMIIALIIGVVFVKLKIKDEEKRSEILSILWTFIFAGIAYIVALLLMYLTIFGKAEAILNQSFVRYSSTIWRALYVYFVMRSIEGVNIDKLAKIKNLGFILIFAFLVFANPLSIIKLAPMSVNQAKYQDAVAMIERNTQKDDRIFIIDQEWSGSNLICLRYYLMPRITNVFDVELHHHENDYPDDFFPETRNAEELKNDLERYQYLYISRIDEGFIERYSELFEQTPVDGGLYRLTEDKYIFVEQVIIDNE